MSPSNASRARVLGYGAVAALACATAGCTTATPRFISRDLQTAVVQDDMQRLETDTLVLYYPRGHRDETLRVASRLEHCRRELERAARIESWLSREKSVFVLPNVPFNNAYVAPPLGSEQIAVLPQFATASDLFVQLGIPPDPAIIGCHEMTHDVQARQVSGFASGVRRVLGHAYTPQAGLDPWFQEGLAVYYETKLQRVGRLANEYFEGHFAAAVAGTDIDGGDLSFANRDVRFGAHYVLGSRFVDFLARRYGEAKLWQVVAEQSNEFFFVLGVNSRFRTVYGRSLSELIEDFDRDVKARYPVRQRPPDQRPLAKLALAARFATATDGRVVTLTQGPDEVASLTVLDADGRKRSSRRLTDLGVGRRLVLPNVELMSGFSLTGEGRHAFFVAVDAGPVESEARLLRFDLERDELEVLEEDLRGSGGSITPDGRRYYFSRPNGDALAIWYYEVASRQAFRLTPDVPRLHLASPVVSPDGTRLLVTEASDEGVRLAFYDARFGRRLGEVPAPPGLSMQGSWVDERTVVYAGSDGHFTQAFEADLVTGHYRKLTDAPYVVSEPRSDGRRVRFLNREGNLWTLDEAPYPREEARAYAAATRAPTKVWAHAAATSRAPHDAAPRVSAEEPYSALERLFVPQVWGPVLSSREGGQTAYGAGAAGGDRLGFQRWALGAAWDSDAKLPSAWISYLNTMASPWYVRLELAHVGRREEKSENLQPPPSEPILIRETWASLLASRYWYGSTEAGVGARYIDADYRVQSTKVTLEQQRFVGPMIALGHSSFERTAYGGSRLGFSATGAATYFPRELSESKEFELVDGASELVGVVPLPLSPRHKLVFSGTGRALLGLPRDVALLQVGGSGGEALPSLDESGQRSRGLLPPGLRFYEPLRGFEDFALYGRRAVAGEALYTMPFIVDAGSATTLGFLPSSFLSQIELDLFASAASLLERDRETALAIGAGLDFKVLFWQLPLLLRFQEARRLSHDEAFAFYFTLEPW